MDDDLMQHLLDEMDKWPKEKETAFMAELQTLLRNRPSDPAAREAWANRYKRKFIDAFELERRA